MKNRCSRLLCTLLLLAMPVIAPAQSPDSPEAVASTVTRPEAAFIAGQADALLLEALAACRALATHKFVLQYYQAELKGAISHKVQTALRRTASRLDAGAVHLLGNDGMVILSTNPVAVNQRLGDWYSFDSMRTDQRVLPTVSVAKRWREFLISVPVRDQRGGVIGEVVIQHGGSLMERVLDWDQHMAPFAFVFRDRYAIATNSSGRALEVLSAVPPASDAPAFTGGALDILDDLTPIGDRVVLEGRPYRLHRIPSRIADWSLVYGTLSE